RTKLDTTAGIRSALMFDRISEAFSGMVRKLSGTSTISEKNVAEAMNDVRVALLEADVAQGVVKNFCAEVLAESVGRDVTKTLNPAQEMIGIVYDRLVALLGEMPEIPEGASHEEIAKIMMAEGPGVLQVSPGPTIVMLCGLQG